MRSLLSLTLPARICGGLLLITALFASPASAVDGIEYGPAATLLRDRCFDCHSAGEDSEGGLDLSNFDDPTAAAESPEKLLSIYNRVRRREMPPRDFDPPSDEERHEALASIEQLLSRPLPGGQFDPGPPILRRLTRLEYNNTVRDLLGLQDDLFQFPDRLTIIKDYFNPAGGELPEVMRVSAREYGAKLPALLPHAGLPGENRAEHGFTNRADALSFSPLLMEKYLELAGQIVESPEFALSARRLHAWWQEARTETPAESVARNASPQIASQVVRSVGVFAPNGNVAETAPGSALSPDRFAEVVADAFVEGIGGVYDVPSQRSNSVIAAGSALGITYGESHDSMLMMTAGVDLWQAAFGTADETSGSDLFTNRRKNQKVFDLRFESSDRGGIVQLGVNVLSRRGESGQITLTAFFSDGGSQPVTDRLVPGAGTQNTFFAFSAPPGEVIRRLHVDGSAFSGEYVLLDDLGFVTGGAAASAAKEPQIAAKSEPPRKSTDPRVFAAQQLTKFIERAWRRPVDDNEIRPYLRLFDEAYASTGSQDDALRAAVRGVLASPRFLYRIEHAAAPQSDSAGSVRPLDDHELASRLSYFLWSSMPDDELQELADAGRLGDPEVLGQQARRMLKDVKSRELSESFAVQWLKLDQLFGARPDRRRFREYYAGPMGKDTLAMPMLIESLLLFETVHTEDRSILDFVDADYTWINDRLAGHYGLQSEYERQAETSKLEKGKNTWVRAPLPDRRRGGVLTLGSTLTLTSLPLRTSPVYRGSWLLETIFNSPPPPPPAMVDELGDDEKDFQEEGLTVRRKFEQHRDDTRCSGCHDRIDPPGFALEHYDAIGRWRDRDGKFEVDSSGELADGRAFNGPADFKELLTQEPDEFVRALTEHMLSYALNRRLEYYDLPTVNSIVRTVREDDYKFSRLIVEVVNSYPFRHARADASGG